SHLHHPDLPSFPTRRSSDLARPDKLAFAGKLLQPGRENRQDPAAWFVLLREARDLAAQGNGPRLATEAIREMDQFFVIDASEMRSEEHTSELQSLRHLVCRL